MERTMLLRGARQLITLRGVKGPRRGADFRNLGVIHNGAVLIANGIIQEVGPARRLENLRSARDAEELNVDGCVVLPGFVDSFLSLTSALKPCFGSLQTSPARVLESEVLRIAKECARQGTTTIGPKSGGKSGNGTVERLELKILRAQAAINDRPLSVVSVFDPVGNVPFGGANENPKYQEWLCSHVLPLVRRQRLAQFISVHCNGSGGAPFMQRHVAAAAQELGFGLRIDARQCEASESVALALELAATSIDGMPDVAPEQAVALAQTNSVAALFPGSAFF